MLNIEICGTSQLLSVVGVTEAQKTAKYLKQSHHATPRVVAAHEYA
jgi:hypothetical protein